MIRTLNHRYMFFLSRFLFVMLLVERLALGCNSPGAIQLLVANFLYSPPGLLQIANAESQLPDWLLQDYKRSMSRLHPKPQAK